MKKPTPAQAKALEAIQAGHISRYTPWTNSRNINARSPRWNMARPEAADVRADTVTRVVSAGWAKVGPRKDPLFAPVVLTDEGAAVVASLTKEQAG